MEIQHIQIPPIQLEWSDWHSWTELLIDGRSGGIRIPNGRPGVYEARLIGNPERLTIGKTVDLRYRIRQGLVKGNAPHSSGDDIRLEEDLSQVEIRWAKSDQPAAVEEELHRLHRVQFGRLPKYTDH